MKPSRIAFKILSVSFILLLTGCHKEPVSPLRDAFLHPKPEAQVRVWWHWMDGAITREGITRDLEAMKEQGIHMATILNVGLFGGNSFGVPRVAFNSPEWYDMFRWAIKEADRLGIVVGAHNCDGWSSSGGPWITPEMSMKQYVWTKTLVTGGKNITLPLPQPYSELGFYRDVAVVAVRTDEAQNSFQMAKPVVLHTKANQAGNDVIAQLLAGNEERGSGNGSLLYDGNPVSAIAVSRGDHIDFVFEQPFLAEKIVVHPRKRFMWSDMASFRSNYSLWISDNRKNYRKIASFEIQGLNQSREQKIPAVSSRYYRLVIDDFSSADAFLPFELAEAELLKEVEKPLYAPAIQGLLAHTVSVKASDPLFFDRTVLASPGKANLQAANVLDITDKMNDKGMLAWDAPNGTWAIIRFGYTTTAARNAPATREGTGLECDKMDTAALNLHFASFPARLIAEAGEMAGKTFRYIFIDSWECGYQNWTARFPEEFHKRRGYSIVPWIPVLCGLNITDTSASHAFLYDFRKTIAELIEENYYRHFRDLCHKYGMEFHAEVIYGGTGYPPLDVLRSNSYADLPMFEFWAGHNPATSYPEYTPVKKPEASFPAFSMAMYDKPVLGAEAYTAQAHYSESPWDLKPFGDRTYCSGINQFILHSYVHQPFDNKPGMTLLLWGSHFNRNNLSWEHLSDWLKYHTRIQSVLQQGNQVSQILYYIGDQLPQGLELLDRLVLPLGYRAGVCNSDVLINKIKESKNKLVLPNGTAFDLLVLPESGALELPALRAIEKLVAEGAVVYGPRPRGPLSLKSRIDEESEYFRLAGKLWGVVDGKNYTENRYKKGKVFWGLPLTEVLQKIKSFPDFETGQADTSVLLYIHKQAGLYDVFFIMNQTDKPLYREALFLPAGKQPELWNPETGTIERPAVLSYQSDGRIRLPLRLGPRQAILVAFSGQTSGKYVKSIHYGDQQVFPSSSMPDPALVPLVSRIGDTLQFITHKPGEYLLGLNNGKTIPVNLTAPDTFVITSFSATLNFSASYPVQISPLSINSLQSWTEYKDPAIRYFSGAGTYTLRFTIPGELTASGDPLLLNLGEIGNTARVILNGKELGTVWHPNTGIPVQGILQEQNELVVEVRNVYRNRIIGDFIEKGKVETVWTSAPVGLYLDKNKPLKPSGLMGPIRVIRIPKAEVKY